jgi:hypothetical protein
MNKRQATIIVYQRTAAAIANQLFSECDGCETDADWRRYRLILRAAAELADELNNQALIMDRAQKGRELRTKRKRAETTARRTHSPR